MIFASSFSCFFYLFFVYFFTLKYIYIFFFFTFVSFFLFLLFSNLSTTVIMGLNFYRFWFKNGLRLFGGSGSVSRTDSDYLAVWVLVLKLTKISVRFQVRFWFSLKILFIVFSLSFSSNSCIKCWLLDKFTKNNHIWQSFFLLNLYILYVIFF